MLGSAEYQASLVGQWYQAYLGRSPSSGELSYWVGSLQAGTTDAQVQAGLLSSAEFLAGHAMPAATPAPTTTTTTGTPATLNLVGGLYQNVLGRPAGATELATYTPLINQGLTDSQAVSLVVNSAGAQSYLIKQDYQQYLNRQADSAGLSGWLALLNAGAEPSDVLAGILTSPEFVNDNGGTPTTYIQGLYQDLLHRTASSAEISQWGGSSAITIVRAMLGSAEYQGILVNQYYQAYLGRAATSSELAGWVASLQAGMTQEQFAIDLLSSAEYLQKQSS